MTNKTCKAIQSDKVSEFLLRNPEREAAYSRFVTRIENGKVYRLGFTWAVEDGFRVRRFANAIEVIKRS